jgi:hypothetical protein
MGCKSVEKVLKNCSAHKNVVQICFKPWKDKDPKKSPFHASFLGNNLNRFQFGTIQMTTSKKDGLWNLKLSYPNQLQWINFVTGIFSKMMMGGTHNLFCTTHKDIWHLKVNTRWWWVINLWSTTHEEISPSPKLQFILCSNIHCQSFDHPSPKWETETKITEIKKSISKCNKKKIGF